MPLGLAQLGHGEGKRRQVRDERDGDQGGVASSSPRHGHQPGGGAYLVPCTSRVGDPAELSSCGAVVAVRCAAQFRVVQYPRRDVQSVGGCPCGVRAGGRIAAGGEADVFRGEVGLAGRVIEDRVLFRSQCTGTLRSVPGRSGAVPSRPAAAAG